MKLEGGDKLTVCHTEEGWSVATVSGIMGGEDGVTDGYCEVELADAGNDNMAFFIGVMAPGWNGDHDVGLPPMCALTARINALANVGEFFNVGAEDYGDGPMQAAYDSSQGEVKVGDRVGMLVELAGGEGGDESSVRIFVNGCEYGHGFGPEMNGYGRGQVRPIVLGVYTHYKGTKVRLLPEAKKPASAALSVHWINACEYIHGEYQNGGRTFSTTYLPRDISTTTRGRIQIDL
jgi:hypothetical protein